MRVIIIVEILIRVLLHPMDHIVIQIHFRVEIDRRVVFLIILTAGSRHPKSPWDTVAFQIDDQILGNIEKECSLQGSSFQRSIPLVYAEVQVFLFCFCFAGLDEFSLYVVFLTRLVITLGALKSIVRRI